jgi:hypothetical protein
MPIANLAAHVSPGAGRYCLCWYKLRNVLFGAGFDSRVDGCDHSQAIIQYPLSEVRDDVKAFLKVDYIDR